MISHKEAMKILESINLSYNTPSAVCHEIEDVEELIQSEKWHKYPDTEPPNCYEEYLVTLKFDNEVFTDIARWIKDANKEGFWSDEYDIDIQKYEKIDNVIAWRELPQPYKEEV